MDALTKLGRYFFAIPVVVFGIQYFLYGRFVGGLSPVPPWAPGGRTGAYLVGAVLLATGIGILVDQATRASALVFGGLFLACVVLLHTQKLSDILYDGVARTRALEPLALAGAAFVLAAGATARSGWEVARHNSDWVLHVGRFLFAFSLVIFGIQHFQYAQFIATLIPAWMPGHLFLAYFTGAALIAAGVGIELPWTRRMAATWLGIMFLLWAVLLHAPRVAAALHNGDEWTSAFVALAMGGGALIVARTGAGRPASA
jgi:uncharacterized membrane protein